MKYRAVAAWAGFVLGMVLLACGALAFLMLAIGTFQQGRTAALVSGFMYWFAAVPLLMMPFSPRVAKQWLGAFLVLFSSVMVLASFNPSPAVAMPGMYQLGAIAFAGLVYARVLLAWRRRRAAPAA